MKSVSETLREAEYSPVWISRESFRGYFFFPSLFLSVVVKGNVGKWGMKRFFRLLLLLWPYPLFTPLCGWWYCLEKKNKDPEKDLEGIISLDYIPLVWPAR